MKIRKNLILIFLLVCVPALMCAFAFTACDSDNKNDNNPAPIAGLFELKDIPFYYENLFITKYDYQFYKNGTVKTTVYASEVKGGHSDIITNYGNYTWNDGADFIYIKWSGSSKVVDLKYTGEYVSNGIMTNYFAGANDSGEVAGKLALASYSVHTYANYYLSNAGGEVIGEKEQYIKKGENATSVKAVAAEGFEFTGWSDGIMTAERRDLSVTDNIIVTANFKQIGEIYKLKYEASYGGKIEGEDYQEVAEGRNATTVKAVSLANSYVFVKWSDGVTTAERTDLNVTEDITVTAEFGWIQKYTYKAYEHGSIEGEAVQYIPSGASGTAVTAIPDEGYTFWRWSDGVTTATRREENTTVNGEKDFIAYFVTSGTVIPDKPEPDTPDTPSVQNYTLTYTAGKGGRIIGTLSQTVESGKDGSSVFAIANEGYEFVGWSDGMQTAERQDTNVNENITVTAQFETINTTEFAGGKGTEVRPYQIKTAEQLRAVEKYSQEYFVLIDNITLEDNFTPMFTDDNMFNGVFDGDGYKISNLTIYNDKTFYTGLFACIGESGSVKNLTLENVNLNGTNYIGGIAGYSLGVIENCSVRGEINYLAENTYKVFVGGIVGRIENKLDKCTTDVNINYRGLSVDSYIGGIAGYFSGGSEMEISDSNSVGDIVCEKTGSDSSYTCVGGLVGYGSSYTTIRNSYTTGAITATVNRYGVYTGGLVGRGYDTTISDSYTTGAITTSGSSHAYSGGFVGYGSSYTTIRNSFTTGDITVEAGYNSYSGGLVGYDSYTTISDSYTTGTIMALSAKASGDLTANAGGLVGYDSYTTISDSYTTGTIMASSSGSHAYAGGFTGCCVSEFEVTSSYTVSQISTTSNSIVGSGGFAGYVNNFKISNAHWLYYADSGVEYAIGYCESMGIPSSIGSTKHTDISDFYTLAEELNNGLDEPVWENIDETSLPTLKYEEEN